MARTWKDIRTETLQLMFGHSINGVIITDSATDNADYLAAMPQAASAALRDLASTASPLVRVISISVSPTPNMLGDGTGMFAATQSVGTELIYAAENPKAFYCEADNPCTAYLEQVVDGGVILRLSEHAFTQRRSFQPWAGLIEFSGNIRLRFLPGSTYSVRNVAFYAVPFASADDIPPFTRYDRYDLRKLTAGQPGYEFMELVPGNVVHASGEGYSRSDAYRWEGDSTILFDHYAQGQYDIYYHACPAPITTETPDDYTPELPDEVLDLVPLYIAARLYADENGPLASSYLNRYMARRAELSSRRVPLGTEDFICESGWV